MKFAQYFFILQCFADLSDDLKPLLEGVHDNRRKWEDLASDSDSNKTNNNS